MQAKVSWKIEDWIELKSTRSEPDKNNISLAGVVCRLNHVVSERSPSTSFCGGAIVWGTARNSDLAWDLVEILDEIKTGEADPAEDEQDRVKLSAHVKDHSRNPRTCQVMVECSAVTGQMTASSLPPYFNREANGEVFSIFYRCE
jgi:hypothetical protein